MKYNGGRRSEVFYCFDKAKFEARQSQCATDWHPEYVPDHFQTLFNFSLVHSERVTHFHENSPINAPDQSITAASSCMAEELTKSEVPHNVSSSSVSLSEQYAVGVSETADFAPGAAKWRTGRIIRDSGLFGPLYGKMTPNTKLKYINIALPSEKDRPTATGSIV